MRTKAKRNKKHHPRQVQNDPVSWAVAGVHLFPTETQRDLLAPPGAAFVKLRQGAADREDWNMLSQSLNLAEALAGLHIGPNLLPAIMAGQSALHQIAMRMLGKGCSTCYSKELVDIEEALAMYQAQLKKCSQAEYSRAIARVKDWVRDGTMDKTAQLYARMNGGAA